MSTHRLWLFFGTCSPYCAVSMVVSTLATFESDRLLLSVVYHLACYQIVDQLFQLINSPFTEIKLLLRIVQLFMQVLDQCPLRIQVLVDLVNDDIFY